jgi:protein-S-isoprenylcysteine O-methyltransferase Ste14
MRTPVDPRLLRQARAARGYLAVALGLGLVGTALILAQATLLSQVLAGAARGTGIAALATGVLVLVFGPRQAPAAASVVMVPGGGAAVLRGRF